MLLIIADDGTTGSQEDWLDANEDDPWVCEQIRTLQAPGDTVTLGGGAEPEVTLRAAQACEVCYEDATRYTGDAHAGQWLCDQH